MPLARTILVLAAAAGVVAMSNGQPSKSAAWREATEKELKEVIPARAPVEKERIETEFRTATGITNGKGQFVAAVLLITAGYSADGKYSHFLLTQVPMTIAGIHLKAGEYAIGWRRNDESLSVRIYDAGNGNLLGTGEATRINRIGRVESFRIFPPAEKSIIQIGRFGLNYELEK
jgi:hypothetical protein